MNMQSIRIPEERLSVLIGSKGSTKRLIEERTKCRISIDEGEVFIEGEGLEEWIAKDIVHAIGRGFNPEKALMLLQDGYVFELLDLSDYGHTPNSKERLKGRIIGEKGRTRRFFETHTQAMISVYGKTVGFIGAYDSVTMAKQAVTMLLSGSRHGAVYRFLQKHSGEMV